VEVQADLYGAELEMGSEYQILVVIQGAPLVSFLAGALAFLAYLEAFLAASLASLAAYLVACLAFLETFLVAYLVAYLETCLEASLGLLEGIQGLLADLLTYLRAQKK